jgi:glycosyltransferase involved in cell wall biosynthesis
MSESHVSSSYWKELVKRLRVSWCNAALVGGLWQTEYLKHLGFPEERIFLGYDAIDNAYFSKMADVARSKREQVTQELALPARYFFANTRFLRRKNIDGLLNSYADYRRRTTGEPWQLVISGSGEMETEWKMLASQLGIETYVHWPGFVQYDLLPSYYALASAFVHPAHREAWGLVVNEAAACGLPVVVGSRVGASCELVRHEENGYLVDTNSQESLTKALLRLSLLDDGQRKAFGARSLQIANGYGPEKFGDGLRQALNAAGCIAA